MRTTFTVFCVTLITLSSLTLAEDKAPKPLKALLITGGCCHDYAAQKELLQTFAEQAVIAIISAESHRALQARTEELTRSVAELQALEGTIRTVCKVGGKVEFVALKSLPNDGKVIDDVRKYT